MTATNATEDRRDLGGSETTRIGDRRRDRRGRYRLWHARAASTLDHRPSTASVGPPIDRVGHGARPGRARAGRRPRRGPRRRPAGRRRRRSGFHPPWAPRRPGLSGDRPAARPRPVPAARAARPGLGPAAPHRRPRRRQRGRGRTRRAATRPRTATGDAERHEVARWVGGRAGGGGERSERPYPRAMASTSSTTGGAGEHRWTVEHAVAEGYLWVCSCGDGSQPVYLAESGAATAARQHARHRSARAEPSRRASSNVPRWRHA